MITAISSFIKQYRARRKREKQLRTCREDGHFLTHSGELTPSKLVGGIPIPVGRAEFWIYSCPCGYSEVNDPKMRPYRRSFEEAERLKLEAGEVTMKTQRRADGKTR